MLSRMLVVEQLYDEARTDLFFSRSQWKHSVLRLQVSYITGNLMERSSDNDLLFFQC